MAKETKLEDFLADDEEDVQDVQESEVEVMSDEDTMDMESALVAVEKSGLKSLMKSNSVESLGVLLEDAKGDFIVSAANVLMQKDYAETEPDRLLACMKDKRSSRADILKVMETKHKFELQDLEKTRDSMKRRVGEAVMGVIQNALTAEGIAENLVNDIIDRVAKDLDKNT